MKKFPIFSIRSATILTQGIFVSNWESLGVSSLGFAFRGQPWFVKLLWAKNAWTVRGLNFWDRKQDFSWLELGVIGLVLEFPLFDYLGYLGVELARSDDMGKGTTLSVLKKCLNFKFRIEFRVGFEIWEARMWNGILILNSPLS